MVILREQGFGGFRVVYIGRRCAVAISSQMGRQFHLHVVRRQEFTVPSNGTENLATVPI
jgi:hypothetical protein